MSNKIRIIVEVVSQPPFETRAVVHHEAYIVESDRLAEKLRHQNSRVIAAVPVEQPPEEQNDE